MFKNILEKPEKHRERWALGLSFTLSAFIFFGWALYRGFISFNFGRYEAVAEYSAARNVANAIYADDAPSPIENSKETFKAAFLEIGRQYKALENTVSNVLVPFVTGIEVYERE